MDQRLIDEIISRVTARLAEAERKEEPSQDCGGCDGGCGKPGLLILNQRMDDRCRGMLDCKALGAHFQVDCASLQSEAADLSRYEVVVLCQLTNEALGRIALGICDTIYTKTAAQAILMGKRIYIPTEEIELFRYATTAPAAYYSMMKERLDLLAASGAVICSQSNLAGLLTGGGAKPEAEQPAACPAPAEPACGREDKEVRVDKRVLTERDVQAAAAAQAGCIRVPAKCILTALAKDCAKDRGIRIVTE